MNDVHALKDEILRLTKEYSELVHTQNYPLDHPKHKGWNSGDPIPYAARVFGSEEVQALVSSSLDFWLTLGNAGIDFETRFSEFLGVNSSLLVNSGSSANLIALSTLTSYKIPSERRLSPGSEVITVAAGFPTTVSPILQVGCIPVFVDSLLSTSNIDVTLLDSAYNPEKTKAVCIAHTLGNPFDIASVLKFCRDKNLWLIEDNCDSLGSTYSMHKSDATLLGLSLASPNNLTPDTDYLTQYSGSFGDISTQSFYPPHHMTLGEGGCVNFSSPFLRKIGESFRDWGRDCWCPSGIDNSCNKRFDWSLGTLPSGYDHKYIYSHVGYNLKPLDLQAAIGLVQLDRLSSFTAIRKLNWSHYFSRLNHLSDFFDFSCPTHSVGFQGHNPIFHPDCSYSDPSWFGFMLLIKPNTKFNRPQFSKFLDSRKIGNRVLFGGNLTRQPAFVQLLESNPESYRISGSLPNADYIMNNAIFLGTYPGLSESMIDYICDSILEFINCA